MTKIAHIYSFFCRCFWRFCDSSVPQIPPANNKCHCSQRVFAFRIFLFFFFMLFLLCTHSAPALNYFTHYYCRPLSGRNWRRRKMKKKISCCVIVITNTFFRRRRRSFASMAICSQFAVLSIVPSLILATTLCDSELQNIICEAACGFVFQWKKESKNINYCYGPLRWSQYITAGPLRWPQTLTYKNTTKIRSNICM